MTAASLDIGAKAIAIIKLVVSMPLLMVTLTSPATLIVAPLFV